MAACCQIRLRELPGCLELLEQTDQLGFLRRGKCGEAFFKILQMHWEDFLDPGPALFRDRHEHGPVVVWMGRIG